MNKENCNPEIELYLDISYKTMIYFLGKSDQIDMSKLRGYQKS